MEAGDDPYQLLGVSPNASNGDIKKAYRKMALQHHPDRQNTAVAREQAHHLFTKISNAYEVLSDPHKRRDYDESIQQQQQQQQGRPFPDQNGNSSRRSSSSRQSMPQSYHYEDVFADLHDPFEIFERVFGQEFGGSRSSSGQRRTTPFGHSNSTSMNTPFGFHDPFFQDSTSFFGGGGGSLFGRGGGGGGGGMGSLFNDPFFQQPPQPAMGPMASMGSMRSMMMNQPMMTSTSSTQSMFSSFGGPGFGGGGGGGTSVSESITTRIVNGRAETVTERIVQHPDGRVERQVLTGTGTNNDGGRRGIGSSQPQSQRRLESSRPRSSNQVVDLTTTVAPPRRSSSSTSTSSEDDDDGRRRRPRPKESRSRSSQKSHPRNSTAQKKAKKTRKNPLHFW